MKCSRAGGGGGGGCDAYMVLRCFRAQLNDLDLA